jgi:predicted ATPase/DNA-binding CsgD family transcriptional regulator/tetratricopeptide (TPR) repeat protein
VTSNPAVHGEQLTRREQETLRAVARRLTNVEIAEEFGVSVRTVESHIAALRRKLMAETRRELIEAARAYLGRPAPAATDSFVGRADVLTEITTLFGGTRWVTVTGHAGVGKTRVALELARRWPSVVVELEHTQAGGVLQAVAAALELDASTSETLLASCCVALSAGRLLLVLDNADRVVEEVADVVGRLLGRVRSLRVVTTSRTPLRRSGETIVELGPLAAESPGDAAIRLFLDRAVGAARTTDLSDLELVATICRRLEGVPLAIELAAARTRHLPLAELDRRLGDGFDTLGTSVNSVARHAALGSAFGWSWDLLETALRDVLAHLAALPRTFDLDLAAVAVGRRVDHEVVELLDRSLLARAGGSVEPARFRMLAALREFVAVRTDHRVLADVARRHAHHHHEIARRLAENARTDDRPTIRGLAQVVRPEIGQALRWAVRNDAPMASGLAVAVGIGIEQYGPGQDLVHALVEAVRDTRLRTSWSAPAIEVIGRALAYSHLDLVGELAERASDLGARGDTADRLAAAQLNGLHLVYRNRPAQALTHLEEAVGLATELGDEWEQAAATQFRAMALQRRGDVDPREVLTAFDEARSAYAAAGDAMHANNTRYMMAVAAAEAGLHDQAAAWAGECLRYAVDHGNEVEIGHARLAGALAAPTSGGDDLAEAALIFRRVGDLRCLTRSLLGLAAREADEAERLLREALDVGFASRNDQCHSSAAGALATLLWDRGRRDEAAAVLGGARRVLPDARLARLVPEALAAEAGLANRVD